MKLKKNSKTNFEVENKTRQVPSMIIQKKNKSFSITHEVIIKTKLFFILGIKIFGSSRNTCQKSSDVPHIYSDHKSGIFNESGVC